VSDDSRFPTGLLARALGVAREEGIGPVTRKGTSYLCRRAMDTAGRRGLYQSDRYLKALCLCNRRFRRYEALANPFHILEVEPTALEYVTGRGPFPGDFKWADIGTVVGGEWDRPTATVEELPVVQALTERFEAGRAWEEIEFIRDVEQAAERGIVRWRGCHNKADVRRECRAVDALYDSICEHGYRRQRELMTDDQRHKDASGRFAPVDEVLVDISRNGEFRFVDGRHRLAIARILDLEAIPVRVSARHRRWQAVRERAVAKPETIPESARTHPDLQALLTDQT